MSPFSFPLFKVFVSTASSLNPLVMLINSHPDWVEIIRERVKAKCQKKNRRGLSLPWTAHKPLPQVVYLLMVIALVVLSHQVISAHENYQQHRSLCAYFALLLPQLSHRGTAARGL